MTGEINHTTLLDSSAVTDYRSVIGVDPAITANASSNETGIIVAGKYRCAILA